VNLLQIGSIREGASTATDVDTTAKQLGDGTTCSLPDHGQWCKVRMGEPDAEFSMAVYNSDDIVSNSICSTGTWELSTSDITDMGQPGHALDIGANVGFYSLVLAAAGWNVTAFEPMAKNTDLIEATLCANPALQQRITLNKFGLGPKDEHCVIISGDDNLGDGVSQCGADAEKPVKAGYSKRGTMDIRRLDDVLLQQHVSQVDFVKMDVEGFECQVMEGGQSLLTKYRPKMIQSEVWHKMQGCLPQDYLASFANASYKVTQDRACTMPDLSRPVEIVNRFMCRKTGVSFLQGVQSMSQNERKIVWLQPDF